VHATVVTSSVSAHASTSTTTPAATSIRHRSNAVSQHAEHDVDTSHAHAKHDTHAHSNTNTYSINDDNDNDDDADSRASRIVSSFHDLVSESDDDDEALWRAPTLSASTSTSSSTSISPPTRVPGDVCFFASADRAMKVAAAHLEVISLVLCRVLLILLCCHTCRDRCCHVLPCNHPPPAGVERRRRCNREGWLADQAWVEGQVVEEAMVSEGGGGWRAVRVRTCGEARLCMCVYVCSMRMRVCETRPPPPSGSCSKTISFAITRRRQRRHRRAAYGCGVGLLLCVRVGVMLCAAVNAICLVCSPPPAAHTDERRVDSASRAARARRRARQPVRGACVVWFYFGKKRVCFGRFCCRF
jgi:hypothetical protein